MSEPMVKPEGVSDKDWAEAMAIYNARQNLDQVAPKKERSLFYKICVVLVAIWACQAFARFALWLAGGLYH